MFDAVFFDCDSTLTLIEGIDKVAQTPRVKRRIAKITNKAMNGKMDFETAIKKKRKILKPTSEQFEDVGQKYIQNSLPGAKELIATLHKNGVETFIISGGFKEAILPFAKYLGIKPENIFANELDKPKGLLSHTNGKATIVQNWNMQNPNKTTAFIGDGVTDLVTKPYVDRFIGFGGVHIRPKVKKEAEYFFENKNLLGLLPLLTP